MQLGLNDRPMYAAKVCGSLRVSTEFTASAQNIDRLYQNRVLIPKPNLHRPSLLRPSLPAPANFESLPHRYDT